LKEASATSRPRNFSWLSEVLTICQFSSKACRQALGNQVEQGGDGAAGGEHGDFLRVVGLFENALQAALDALDETQPAFQARRVGCRPASAR
jgi:hypothetical protein